MIPALALSLLLPLGVLYPVHNLITRQMTLAGLLGLWLLLLIAAWPRRRLRFAVLPLPLLLLLPALLPGRAVDREALRRRYVVRLLDYEGVPYVWGGENGFGIDCSGLARKAFRQALLAEAFAEGNPALLREYVRQWRFDASARALGQGYRRYTVPLPVAGPVAEMPGDALLPGDLAVTTDGVHVMIYLGGRRWIQAAPEAGGVRIENPAESASAWYRHPAAAHRWRLLAD